MRYFVFVLALWHVGCAEDDIAVEGCGFTPEGVARSTRTAPSRDWLRSAVGMNASATRRAATATAV
jgi:hypothetical protein